MQSSADFSIFIFCLTADHRGRLIAGLKDYSSQGATYAVAIGEALKSSDAFAVWPAKEVWALFDAMDTVMNGAIFPSKQVSAGDCDRRRAASHSSCYPAWRSNKPRRTPAQFS